MATAMIAAPPISDNRQRNEVCNHKVSLPRYHSMSKPSSIQCPRMYTVTSGVGLIYLGVTLS